MSDFQKVSEEYLLALYRSLFKRDPDVAGFRHWSRFLSKAGLEGFSRALAGFAESDEFKTLHIHVNDNSLEKFSEFDFGDLDAEVLSSLFEKTSSCWQMSASRPSEVYWSVLTSERYRSVLDQNVISEFLATGKGEVERIRAICREIDFDFDSCSHFLD